MSSLKQLLCITLLAFTAACAGQSTTPSHTHAKGMQCAECCKKECADCTHCQQEDCECPHCAAHHRSNNVAHELLHKKMGKYPSCEKGQH
jgi:hypothetical protein